MKSTGSSAVRESKKAREQQAALDVITEGDVMMRSTDKDGVRNVKRAGTKTFYLENGVWVDSTYKEDAKLTEVKLKFASNEYFDLITKHKDLAKFFAIGEKVVVVWRGKVYRSIE